jgi:hypothetical protein
LNLSAAACITRGENNGDAVAQSGVALGVYRWAIRTTSFMLTSMLNWRIAAAEIA